MNQFEPDYPQDLDAAIEMVDGALTEADSDDPGPYAKGYIMGLNYAKRVMEMLKRNTGGNHETD